MLDKPMQLTDSQLNEYVKSLIDGSPFLNRVYVRGEISNFKCHYSGHLYFTLKDENAALKCVMFRSDAARLKFMPCDSMKVLVGGSVSVFARDGAYQLYAKTMEDIGLGELYAAYEEMKKRLEAKGYFDAAHKKPLPRFPKTVGIITSPIGAAVADMKNILTRRYPLASIIICPAKVQGENAHEDLIRGIKTLDGKVDVILIGRGGGSIEDLWAFNNEAFAKEIYECNTPVISCVGHETDFTICDFVSDLRAPTPSAAAELAVPDKEDLSRYLESMRTRIGSSVGAVLQNKRQLFDAISARSCFTSPLYFTERRGEELDSLTTRTQIAMSNIVQRNAAALSAVAGRLAALNPMNVLSRGYAAVLDTDGNVVDSVTKANKDDILTLKMADGDISAKVL